MDGTGAVIVGAQVTIKNMADGFTRELVTNRSGFYSTPNLSPGPYSVTASAKGFKSEVRTGLTLTVGADVEVNLDDDDRQCQRERPVCKASRRQ